MSQFDLQVVRAALERDRPALRRLAYEDRDAYQAVLRQSQVLSAEQVKLAREALPPPPGSGGVLWLDEEIL